MTALLVSGDFSTWGGMDRANYELAWYLADEAGVHVQLVAYAVAEPLASHPNVLWHRVPKPLNSYTLAAPLLARHGRAAARKNQALGGRTIVNGGNCIWPDINWVHAVHRAWEPRIADAPAGFRVRSRISRRGILKAERHALRDAKVVIANSGKTRTHLVEDLGVPADRVHTIYFGADPRVFCPAAPAEKLAARARLKWPEQTLTAIFVGSLGYDRNKGFDILFAAWRELCADPAWDVDLVAVGGGAEVGFWQSSAEQAGLSQRIRMMGVTREIADVLHAADVMVQPSFYEAYGMAVHEALCCGVPALVTRSAGVAERYPAELTDLLLDAPPSVRDVVDRLRRWRADRESWQSRLQNFSGQLRQRSWRDMAQEFVGVAMPDLRKTSP